MTDLITKLEEAGEGSRALDGAICLLLGQQPEWATKHCAPRQPELWTDGKPGTWAREWLCPRYTTSLDAALALAEQVLGEDEALYWLSYVVRRAEEDTVNGSIKGLPLDLCAAILRASEEKQS